MILTPHCACMRMDHGSWISSRGWAIFLSTNFFSGSARAINLFFDFFDMCLQHCSLCTSFCFCSVFFVAFIVFVGIFGSNFPQPLRRMTTRQQHFCLPETPLDMEGSLSWHFVFFTVFLRASETFTCSWMYESERDIQLSPLWSKC